MYNRARQRGTGSAKSRLHLGQHGIGQGHVADISDVVHAGVRVSVVEEASNQIPVVVVDVHVDVARERSITAVCHGGGLWSNSVASVLNTMGVVVGDGGHRELVGVFFVVGVAKVADGVFITGQAVDDLVVVSGVLVAASGIETFCDGVSVGEALLAEHLLTEVLVGSRIGIGAPEFDLLVGASRGVVQVAPLSHTVIVVVGCG